MTVFSIILASEGGQGRRGVGIKRDAKARMPEVETGIFYLSRLRGYQEVRGQGA